MIAPLFFEPINSQPQSPKSASQASSPKNTEDFQAIVDNESLMTDLSLLFESLLSNLRASECLRERISKRKTFNKALAFEYCDFDGDSFISVDDLKQVLLENGA
jgi:hypothetical protein